MQAEPELAAVRTSLWSGRPLATDDWTGRVAERLNIDLKPHPRGRPPKEKWTDLPPPVRKTWSHEVDTARPNRFCDDIIDATFPPRPGFGQLVGLAGGNSVNRSLAMTVNADRHLLFGLLALQTGMINQGQLVAAFQAWTLDKSRSLADHLEARGDLTAARRALLEALSEVHLETHGGVVEASLAAVSAGKSTRESLARIGDPEIGSTLGHLASAPGAVEDGDDDRTTSYAVGSATSDGQRFRVLRPHARGGLGAVFVALDSELNREVALKQILGVHADDPTSRQRFLLEAEITGGLEHPGIVPVYGMGTYGDGRPYYAMRFIKGDNLKEAIERFHTAEALKSDAGARSLELRKLLRRFTDVCNAIDYAHSRGVLHRDIKPGDIIVGKYGETLMVDWGLAKPLGRVEPGYEGGERTLAPYSASGSADTLPGSALGTPAYMSPEQARGDLEHLGPRSDVYSLGATLYCLLTGRPPFEGDDLGAVLRAVQRGEFAPPRQIIPKIDRALEAISKAMALLPEDRYATPRALAEDTEQWMADEPVTAWREPRVTRIARWARRHRPLVAGAAALLFAAVVALSLGTVLINRERARAEANFRQARSAVDEYFTKVSESKLLDVPGLQPLRKELLESARKYYEGFLAQRDHDSNVRAEAAATYYRLALLTQLIGSPEAAVALYRKAIELYEELARAKPGLARFQSDLAICCNDLGNLYRISGRSADALATIKKSLAIREPLARAHSGLARYQNELAKSYGNLAAVHGEAGRPMDALDSCRRAREINARLVNDLDPDLRFPSDLGRRYNVSSTFRLDMVRDLLATSYAEYGLGRFEESLRTREEASHLAEALAREHPTVPEMQELQATCYGDIGIVLSDIGRPTDALRILDQARSILERLVADSSTVVRYQKHLAATENNIGGVLIMIGRSREGMASFERARAILTRLAADNPSITWFRYLLAESHRQAGYELDRAGRTADGLGRYEQARAILERLVTDDPAVVDFRFLLASTHAEIGASLARSGRVALALASYESARIGQEALAAESPSLTSFQDQLVQIYNHIGRLMKDTGHPSDAERSYRRAEAIQNKLASEHPSVYVYQSTLAYTCRGLARVSVQLGQEDAALRWLEKAAALDLRHADVFHSGSLQPGMRPGSRSAVVGSSRWKAAASNT